MNIASNSQAGQDYSMPIGNIFAVAACLLFCGLYASVAAGQPLNTVNLLWTFNGTDASAPQFSSLVQGTDGALYGTTSAGGTHGLGTIFKIGASGSKTIIYNFDNTTGAKPEAGLMLAADGFLYGTTSAGGAKGAGTIFKASLAGALATIHSFSGPDGAGPICVLLQASDGSFYGTTNSGGTLLAGTVFKIAPNGNLTTLHVFGSVNGDGNYPFSGIIQGFDGAFYGTTKAGGSSNSGTVYKITPQGILTTLHSFNNVTDGGYPYANLTLASDGLFYGTNTGVANTESTGTIFQITATGNLTTLYSFPTLEGKLPEGGLIQASDGNLYGTAKSGGVAPPSQYGGTLFKITNSGVFTKLNDFNFSNGAYPMATVLQATDGNIYGTTNAGGNGINVQDPGDGIVYSFVTGLRPFIKSVPNAGGVGSIIRILGTNLIGTTSVDFNGIPAPFTVASGTEVLASVPSGASSGTVHVNTPRGLLSTITAFKVLP